MSTAPSWPLVGILLLGVWHGINPGMGWLFAVALGLQEGRGSAVWRALLPLALGHGVAIAVTLAAATLLGLLIPLEWLTWGVAGILFLFGSSRLVKARHPRWGGMQVGAGELTVWSFLMASAHGAGHMVLPFLLKLEGGGGYGAHSPGGGHLAHPGHGEQMAAAAGLPGDGSAALVAVLLHTAGYLLITGGLALLVYRKLGLRFLRTAWVNLDLIWGVALILTALATPFL